MTEAELDDFLAACPFLFHMAEAGAWESIRAHGLLSTSALLDLCGVPAPERAAIEAGRRAAGVTLTGPAGERIAIRDNGPMSDASLERCLDDGVAPADWYRLLNARTFFWTNRPRLDRLLAARTYRARAHDVLTLDARTLVEAYADRIALSPINSGATSRFPARRGLSTFRTIPGCPWGQWRAKRGRKGAVVELAVLGGIPDIERFVTRVTREGGGEPACILVERDAGLSAGAPVIRPTY
ncbi:DUF7002 family protein [Antarcticirhabdus aurantiaca]|uniref:Uncharacterized protein n=1 Tax=Antarcticirhabdus aurantiaca TaxID=2606717 RepID=A0ACD4NJH4_9HYPH|nr:hypothetical protein [Antarcticirhabdus aurantiaca]WAJ26944.1 hypothetical protein OXU80_19040 [Jeongeuplla avenae]